MLPNLLGNVIYLVLPVSRQVYLAFRTKFVVFKLYLGLILIAYLVNLGFLLARAWPDMKFAAKVAYMSSLISMVGLQLLWIILQVIQMKSFYNYVYYMYQYSINLL